MKESKIEFDSADAVSEFQFRLARETLTYLGANSPYYKKLFHSNAIVPEDINSWSGFEKLPTTSKDDVQNFNWDFLCVPKSEIVEYTSTSGTLGKPVTIPLTEKDLQRLAYNESMSFGCADGNADDLYQLMLTLDRQFMAGIAYYEGIRKMGAGLVRVGPGLPALQWETIERLKPTALVAVPSFIVKLIEYAQMNGIDLDRSSVKKAICIGESIRHDDLSLNTIGQSIQTNWNIKLYSTYASTEMQTAFTECSHGVGGHLRPELLYVELLDENDNVVKPGEPGEVTITTFGIEAMPLLRYKTGDIARVHHEPCQCGRNTLRLGPVLGRKNQMIKLKGTTVYPPAIFDILQQVHSIQDFVVEVFTGKLGTDDLKLHVVAKDERRIDVEGELKSAFQSRIRVVPEIRFVSLAETEKMQHSGTSRKIKKFIDNR